MEPLLETIDLDIEEANELLFKVKVEGVEQAPAKVRLVCEVGDVAYMFNGHATPEEGIVQFLLPTLKGKLPEGVYPSRVEVLIENRYFAPVSFNICFKQAMKVVAEAVRLPERKAAPKVTVTAAPVIVKQPTRAPEPAKSEMKPALIESPTPRSVAATKTPQATTRRAAPPDAKFNSAMTLKERYVSRLDQREELNSDVSEELVHELAQSLLKRIKSKR